MGSESASAAPAAPNPAASRMPSWSHPRRESPESRRAPLPLRILSPLPPLPPLLIGANLIFLLHFPCFHVLLLGILEEHDEGGGGAFAPEAEAAGAAESTAGAAAGAGRRRPTTSLALGRPLRRSAAVHVPLCDAAHRLRDRLPTDTTRHNATALLPVKWSGWGRPPNLYNYVPGDSPSTRFERSAVGGGSSPTAANGTGS